MAIITIPNNLAVEKFSWGQKRNDVTFRSSFGSQSVETSPPIWTCTISAPTQYESTSGSWQALILQLKGSINQLACHNMGRPIPSGSMRGTMTLSSSAAQGATTLVLTSGVGQAFKTLLAGDMIGIGSGATQQVLCITADATANSGGVITLNTEPPLRNAFAGASAITWDSPKALFRQQNGGSNSWDYTTNFADSFTISLIEDWRP